MIISIHQPDYIPYIGYFYKIAQSDIFVFLDDVQFSNDNMHHWNRIKTPQGEHRLKIPLEYKHGDKINKVRTKDELKWKEKHLKTIEMSYSRSKYFDDVFPGFTEILLKDYSSLAEMNIAINKYLCNRLGIGSKFVLASELGISSNKEERVIDICKKLGGTTYISGNGAKAYQSQENFARENIELIYTDYKPINYKQLWKEFVQNMSILDYFFNCGFGWTNIIDIIKGSR